jgi:hypothetical protein
MFSDTSSSDSREQQNMSDIKFEKCLKFWEKLLIENPIFISKETDYQCQCKMLDNPASFGIFEDIEFGTIRGPCPRKISKQIYWMLCTKCNFKEENKDKFPWFEDDNMVDYTISKLTEPKYKSEAQRILDALPTR